jgi:hypothetical protein
MENLLQRILLSSDPDNEDLKVLVFDCLYIPWLKGEFLPEFAPEHTGPYLIALQNRVGASGTLLRLISGDGPLEMSLHEYATNSH